jgi:hypothetical protein
MIGAAQPLCAGEGSNEQILRLPFDQAPFLPWSEVLVSFLLELLLVTGKITNITIGIL